VFYFVGPKRKRSKATNKPKPKPFPFQEDPVKPSDVERLPKLQEYHVHWNKIRTRFSRNNKLANWYNYRLSSLSPDELNTYLHQVFDDQTTVFKLNISFGYILRSTVTDELQYHYASRNNNNVFDAPLLVRNENDLHQVQNDLQNLDILEWARQLRPSTKWVVDSITNITFFTTNIPRHPIGRGKSLPHYIVENRGIVPLDCDKRTGRVYNDDLCFFRAFALHNGCHTKNLERDAKFYYRRLVIFLNVFFYNFLVKTLCKLIYVKYSNVLVCL